MFNLDKLQKEYLEKCCQLLLENNELFVKNVFKIHYISHYGSTPEIYVFFKTDEDLRKNLSNRTAEIIKNEIILALKIDGYFSKFGSEIRFVFDSDENVKKNYKGNYYLRLL